MGSVRGVRFAATNKTSSGRNGLPGIKPVMGFEYPAPADVSKLPEAVESVTMLDGSLLDPGVRKGRPGCPVEFAEGVVATGATFLSVEEIEALFEDKNDGHLARCTQCALCCPQRKAAQKENRGKFQGKKRLDPEGPRPFASEGSSLFGPRLKNGQTSDCSLQLHMRKAHAACVESDSIKPFDAHQQPSAGPVNERTLAVRVMEKSMLPRHACSKQRHAAAGHAEQAHATVQVAGPVLHLPLPKALGAGWVGPANFKTVAPYKTPDQKATIEEFPKASLRRKCGAVPPQEQRVAQVDASHPNEQHLTRAQVSQYFTLCCCKLRKQATQADLDPQGQGDACVETAARAVACAGALPGNRKNDFEGGDFLASAF